MDFLSDFDLLSSIDSNFKYILILFNLMTLVVVYVHKNRKNPKKQHHILFVTAHPDDQVMFFRPAIKSISNDYNVHLLCLSNNEKLRDEQLIKSGQNLNLFKLQSLKENEFKDQMNLKWPQEQIRKVVLEYVKKNQIKAIFTFDDYGVSGHENHCSISRALKKQQYLQSQLKFLNKDKKKMTSQEIQSAQQIKKESIKIYHLKSVNLIRKYSGALQIFISLIRDFSWININIIHAYKSMKTHKSQFVWYRKLWLLFSQYTYINVFTLGRIKIYSKIENEVLPSNKQVQEEQLDRTENQKMKNI